MKMFHDCEYYMGCEMWPCHERAVYSIGQDGAPKSQWTHICPSCADKLLKSMKDELEPKPEQKEEPLPFEDGPEPEEQEEVPYEEMTNKELHDLLEAIGISVSSKSRKEDLIKLLKDAETHEYE